MYVLLYDIYFSCWEINKSLNHIYEWNIVDCDVKQLNKQSPNIPQTQPLGNRIHSSDNGQLPDFRSMYVQMYVQTMRRQRNNLLVYMYHLTFKMLFLQN